MANPLLRSMVPELEPTETLSFKAQILRENILRLKAVGAVGSLLNVGILYLDRDAPDFPGIGSQLRIAWITASLLYIVFGGTTRGTPAYSRFRYLLFLAAAALSLFFSASITITIATGHGTTLLYVINILLTGAVFYLFPWELVGIVVPSSILLGYAMFAGQGSAMGELNNQINVIGITFFALLVSFFNWRSRRERFVYETTIRKNNELLKSLADLDGLTNIANRRKIDQLLISVNAIAHREGISIGVLMIDIDQFKAYNDTYGHLEGDTVLKRAADAMKGALYRESDSLGRYGGEEFLVLLPGTDIAGTRVMGERLIRAVAELGIPHAASSHGSVTISAGGAAGVPQGTRDLKSLIADADAALYRAKAEGRNRLACAGDSPSQAQSPAVPVES
jgi:diguanylate cyclase (GGDEF)-like protein